MGNNLSVPLGNDGGTEAVGSCWKINDIKSKWYSWAELLYHCQAYNA